MTRAPALTVVCLLLAAGCSAEAESLGRPEGAPAPEAAPPPAPQPLPVPGEPADTCNDGLDNDGNGRADEGCACEAGATQPCWIGDPALAGVGACTWGRQDCVAGVELGMWGTCLGQGAATTELCDGVDNDCDGETDEGCECRSGTTQRCYTGPGGTLGLGLCAEGSRRCIDTADGSTWGPCEGETLPGVEVCDGAGDEDCDGQIDEGCACTAGERRDCYGGPAATRGVGACRAGTQTCAAAGSAAGWGACDGEVVPSREVCSGGGDEDCDGRADCADPDCETDPACCTPFDENVPVVPAEGEIMFVVDRSGSMQWPASATGSSRWAELESAMATVLPDLRDLHTGLTTFPELTGGDERLSCEVGAGPDLGFGLAQHGPILDRLGVAAPRAGDTPTPQVFARIQAYFEAHPTTRQRFVVLATDGLPEPNCGSTVEATVEAIARLRRELGVETFVLGIVGPSSTGSTAGIPALRDALNLFADAGGRPRAGALRYYEAVDGPALTRGLDAIVAAATDCHVELSAAPARPAETQVYENGTLVPPSGYVMAGRSLELLGSWCDAIRSGLVTDITVADACSR